jgi:hypothetical protein
MCLTENPEEIISVVEVNSELRQAQLELLSADCATHKLRLRFSTEDLARFGSRELLRKSVATANSLNEYYSSIEKQIPAEPTTVAADAGLSEEKIVEAVGRVSSYLRDQRDYYLPSAAPLSRQQRAPMSPYFSAALLDQIRVVERHGARIPNPPFYAEAKALGLNPPDFTHMNSLTFLDVIVFNEELTERTLFHALVHAVQFQVLGSERYSELFVRNFLNAKFHFLVPTEGHAFLLESKFALPEEAKFSVEDQVRLWAKENRY